MYINVFMMYINVGRVGHYLINSEINVAQDGD